LLLMLLMLLRVVVVINFIIIILNRGGGDFVSPERRRQRRRRRREKRTKQREQKKRETAEKEFRSVSTTAVFPFRRWCAHFYESILPSLDYLDESGERHFLIKYEYEFTLLILLYITTLQLIV